jgi:hypothetical protein
VDCANAVIQHALETADAVIMAAREELAGQLEEEEKKLQAKGAIV